MVTAIVFQMVPFCLVEFIGCLLACLAGVCFVDVQGCWTTEGPGMAGVGYSVESMVARSSVPMDKNSYKASRQ